MSQPELPKGTTASSSSPEWQPGTRLVVGVLLLLVVTLLIYAVRQLLAPMVLALLLAYLLLPLVNQLERRARLPRWLAVSLVYVVLLLVLAGTGTGIGLAASQALDGMGDYLEAIAVRLPTQLEQLLDLRFTIGPWLIDLGDINIDPVIERLTAAVSPLLSQTGRLLSAVASATVGAVGTTLLMLVIGFYLLLDTERLGDHLLKLVPDSHKGDAQLLMRDGGRIWQAFLRGQLILALVLGAATTVVMALLGVRFALGLGLVAGLLEFVPIFGPWITALISVLVAVFQSTNPWGLTPIGFALLVLAASALLQQIESNILYPRIIGHSLNLNPLVVLLALLAAGSLAGVVGLLLAAPAVATLRLVFGYLYWKVVGVRAPAPPVLLGPVEARTSWLRQATARLRRRKASTVEAEQSQVDIGDP